MDQHIPDGIKSHIDELAQGITVFERYVRDLEERADAAKPKADESAAIDAQIVARRKELVELETKLTSVQAAHAKFVKIVNG